MKVKTRNIILGVLFATIVLFLAGYISGHRGKDRATEALSRGQADTISYYETKIDGINTYIASVEQEIKSLRQAKHDGDVTNQELRKLNLKQVNEISRLGLKIDTLLQNIDHNGQVIDVLNTQIVNYKAANDSISRKAILLPFSFNKQDKWLNLNGTFNYLGKLDINLKLDFKADLIAGIDRDTKKNKALLTTDCPYIKTVTFNSIKLDLPKEKKINVSLFLGYGLTKDLKTSPILGIGVGRSILKF